MYLLAKKAIDELDDFDLAFLTLTDHVVPVDTFDLSFYLACKTANRNRWGAMVLLLSGLFKRAWDKECKSMCVKIKRTFDLEGKITVDGKKAQSILAKGIPNINIWKHVKDGVSDVLYNTIENSMSFTLLSFYRRKKADSKIAPEAWAAYYHKAQMDHIKAFTEAYPERILHPQITRLVQLAETSPGLRTIDRADLFRRIERVDQIGHQYFDNLSDVHVGRLWNFTALEMAHNASVTYYQVISQRDKRVCPVCNLLDGKTFGVQETWEKINGNLFPSEGKKDANALAEAIQKAFPFPRVRNIDNLSPSQVAASGYFPPFHPLCRCQIVMLWSEKSPLVSMSKSKIETRITMPLLSQMSGWSRKLIPSEVMMRKAVNTTRKTDKGIFVLSQEKDGLIFAVSNYKYMKDMLVIENIGHLGNMKNSLLTILKKYAMIAKESNAGLRVYATERTAAWFEQFGVIQEGLVFTFSKQEVDLILDAEY